jgi:hypothetical protein
LLLRVLIKVHYPVCRSLSHTLILKPHQHMTHMVKAFGGPLLENVRKNVLSRLLDENITFDDGVEIQIMSVVKVVYINRLVT